MRLTRLTCACLLAIFGLAAQCQSNQSSAISSSEKLPAVTVRSIVFENVKQLSTAQQEEIASDIQSRSYHGAAWLEEVDERIRYAWQRFGYFGAQSHSNAHQINDDPQHQEVELISEVDEGRKYVLQEIDWEGGSMFTKEQLDASMPIHRLDDFDVTKVRKGLDNLRKLYDKRGYVHLTAVPDTKINDADGTVTLIVTLMPGEVYRVGSVSFVGGNADERKRLELKWPLRQGDPFNPELIVTFFTANSSLLPSYASIDQSVEQSLSEKTHTVDLTVHLERR